ncbi:hypothetical protein EJ02DRAFT_504125 [Clathrospora elynae]|uniref:Rhodopsin domain-containing protein n=1 Tax=Clathrospora elynae TaxID=706981 RepID=A0A6A5STU0_9PLEO|nr:hypothetical protein EJ02DRAFT_504125 [Clathrospora elynae]
MLNIFLTVFPFVQSFTVVAIRVWRRISERQFAIEDIPKGTISQVDIFYWRYVNNAIYNPILGLVKISFLVTLLQLCSQNRLIVASLWTLVAVNILFIFAATLGSVFMCWPVHKYWNLSEPGTCGNRAQYIFDVIGITIATDVLVTLIPAWILHDLRMSLKKKIGVIVFLSLPLTVTAIGCYRLHTFVVVFSLPTLSVEDPYNVRNTLSNIESNLAVIAACGPTIKWILVLPRQRSRGYLKNDGDLELRSEGLKNPYPIKAKVSCWQVKDGDADRGKQHITVKLRTDIRKTTVVEWESSEVQTPSPVLHAKNKERNVSFQLGI